MARKAGPCGKQQSYPNQRLALRALTRMPFNGRRRESRAFYCAEHKAWHPTSAVPVLAKRQRRR